jgi:uncharacterized membrane protein
VTRYAVIYLIGTAVTLSAAILGFSVYGKVKGIEACGKGKSLLPVLLFMFTAYVVIFSVMKDLTVLSHRSYIDFAVYLDYFNNFASGRGLFSTLEESLHPGLGHWLSVHFTPIAFFFAALFKLWPSFHTINWSQTIFLALAVLILYQIARPRIGDFGAFCLSAALLLNPTFQYITLNEFEYMRFVIPIGVLAVGFLLTAESALVIFLSSLSVLLVREDAAFFMFGMGIFVFAFRRKKMLGAGVAAFSVAYLFLVLYVIMPLFRDTANHSPVAASYFTTFGSTAGEIISNILEHPLQVFSHFFHPYKSVNYYMYLLPFSFVPLFGIKVLLTAFPTALMLGYSSYYVHSSYFLYYVSPILVAAVWSTVEGIPYIERLMIKSTYLRNYVRLPGSLSIERVSFAVLCGSLACSIYFGPSPVSIQFWNKDFSVAPFRTTTFHWNRYVPTNHDVVIRRTAALIPPEASVSAEQALLQDVYRCKALFAFPQVGKADYVFIDKKNDRKIELTMLDYQERYDRVEKNPSIFELVKSEDGVLLYKRKARAKVGEKSIENQER